MPRLVRFLGVLLFFAATFIPKHVLAQCLGLPTVQTLGSNKVPDGFCAPVGVSIKYDVTFLNPVPTGTLELVVDWGDGGAQTVVGQTANGAVRVYSANVPHTFPVDSDCEFLVVMTMRYNGVLCPNTRQQQKIASWRTDAFNGGNVQLLSPDTGTDEHLVCRGQDISVVFEDATEFNCNADYTHLGTTIETPNIENRWQQIVYNTPVGGSKIPNVSVAGVPVTGAGGTDIRADYQDPRNPPVFYMATPVVLNDPRKRDTQVITAPGGFGAGFPQVGDVLEVTIRYWNFCNPYSENPGNPLVPMNGDLINGDNPPVERTAQIRIVDSPPAPGGGDQTVCNGITPGNYSITGVPANNIVNWYRNNAGDVPGALITSGPSTTLPVTSHPNWVNNTTPGVYKVWASYEPNVVGATNCESPKVLLTRVIREPLTIPDPNPALPTEVCNGTGASPTTVTISLTGPASETIGGPTTYSFNGSAGVTLTSSTANTATFNINTGFAPGVLFVDRTIRVDRQYTTTPNCSNSRTFTIRIYNRPVGGTPSAIPDVCETTPLGTIVLNGYLGTIVRWEERKDAGAYGTYTGASTGASISPGTRTPGIYRFRAVVNNGVCTEVYSAEEIVEVFDSPVNDVTVGADQFWCGPPNPGDPLTSTAMGGTDPMGLGTGTWTYVSSFPAGRPAPTISDIHAPNAFITTPIGNEGAYTMRWTIENGTCTDFADIIIDFGSTPTPSVAGPAQDLCGENTTLAGNTPIIGFGKWTILSGPAGPGDPGNGVIRIADDTSPTSALDLVGPAFAYGTYVLQWQIKSGSCPVSNSTVSVKFNQPATVAANDISTVCIGPTTYAPIALSGTIGGGATTGQWINVSGNGTITGNTVSGTTVTAAYTPNQADYDAGVSIRVKLVSTAPAPCGDEEKEIIINIDRTPLVDAGADITNICADNVQLNAENPPPYGATGLWTTAAAGVTFDDPTDPRTFVHGLPASPLPNTTVVRWTLTSASGLCAAPPVSINLTRVSPPTAGTQTFTECEVIPAGAPVVTSIILSNYQATILAASGGTSITWYKNAAPPTGTIVPNPAVAQTNIADGQIYIARVAGGSGCTSDVLVTIRVRALPPALDKDVALCEDVIGSNTTSNVDLTQAAYINAITGGAAGVGVTWFDNQADASNNASPIVAPFDVIGSRTVYGRVTYTASPNCFDIGELRLSVKNLPTNAEIFGRESVCKGDDTIDPDELPVELYQVTPITGAKYHWDIPDNPATEFKVFGGGTEDDFFVLLQFPNQTTLAGLTIRAQVEINGCLGPVIEKVIVVNPTPADPILNGASVVCENDNGIPYTIGPPSNYPASSYNWEIRKVSDNSLGGAFVADGQTTDRILVNFLEEDVVLTVRESNSICVSKDVSKTIVINRRPVMEKMDESVCSDAQSGVVFQADGTSPVPIDHYEIISETMEGGLTPAQPAVAPGNYPANVIETFSFENLTAVPLPVNYSVRPYAIGPTGKECPGAQEIITLNIKPEPQLDPNLNRSICSGDATQIILVSATNTFPADKFFIDAYSIPAGVTALAALPPADGTTQYNADVIKDHKWENISGTNKQVRYTIRPYSTLLGCAGNPPSDVLVTVYPKTIVDAITPIVLCNGDPLNITFTSTASAAPNPDADYIWSVRSFDTYVNITGPTTGTGSIAGMVLDNTSQTADGTVIFEVQGKNSAVEGECIGPVLQFTVTIRKSPKATSLDLTACSDAPNGTTYTANLKDLEAAIVQQDPVPADTKITWHTNPAPFIPGDIIPAASLTAYVMQNNIPVYAEVEYLPTGCKNVATIRYTVNPSVGVSTTKVDVDCFGSDNGQITVNVTGGTPSYSYRINGGPFINLAASTYTFNSLVGGSDYVIDVKDSKGCTTTTPTIRIGSPTELQVNYTSNDILCFLGTNGEIKVTASGGTTPYKEFRILQNGFVDPDNDGLFPNLGAGSYTIRVTDGNDCTRETPLITLVQPPLVEVTTLDVAADANGNNLSCRDAVNGSIEVTVTGGMVGSTVYSYQLTNSNDPTNPIMKTGTAHEIFNNATGYSMGAGTYTVKVFDANNCPSRDAIAIIANPPPFDAGLIGTDYSLCLGSNPQKIAELAPASGGVGNYTYEWQRSVDLTTWNTIPAASGAGSAFIAYTPGSTELATPGTYYYRRLVQSISTLPNTTSTCPSKGDDRHVTITVNEERTASISAPAQVCEGSPLTVEVSLSVPTIPATGTSVFFFSYINTSETVNDARGFQDANGVAVGTISVSSFTQDDTYTLVNVKDPFGCPAKIVTPTADIKVIKTPVSYNIIGSDALCPNVAFQFEWQAEPTIKYRWDFGDHTPQLPPVTGLSGTQTTNYTYQSFTADNSVPFTVTLFAQNGTCPERAYTDVVTVFPNIQLNIYPGDPVFCGGQTVTFLDQSKGVDAGEWYYRVQGTTDKLEPKSGPVSSVTYTLENNTAQNPLVYEVVYEAGNNEGCEATYQQLVTVYRKVTADFTIDNISPYVGGVSTVTYTNTSDPANSADMEYTWDFDDIKATPPNAVGWGPTYNVVYPTAGTKHVSLKVVNVAARNVGETCEHDVIHPAIIMLPNVGAAFKMTPLAACFPTEITVENLSPGADTFDWALYNQGTLVANSNARNPVFTIQSPGVYTLHLTASYLASGQTVVANPQTVEVFESPIAAFDFRPNPVYVPDTELSTFNLSKRAGIYSWDFDDGFTSQEFQPKHTYTLEGKYNITLIAGYDNGNRDVNGDGVLDGNIICYDTTRQVVVAIHGGAIKIPNAFTPNPNGSTGGSGNPGTGTFNDVFLPISSGIEEFTMQIFDRWGTLIFESKDKNIGWDGYDRNGHLLPAGVYVYKLVMRLSNGQRTTKVGDVTLIR